MFNAFLNFLSLYCVQQSHSSSVDLRLVHDHRSYFYRTGTVRYNFTSSAILANLATTTKKPKQRVNHFSYVII